MYFQITKNLFIILLFLFLQQYLVEPKSMNVVQKLENGFVKILDSGSRFHFSCKEGFQLIGESEIYYENNKWSNKMPVCVPIRAQIDFPLGNYVVSEEGRKYTFSCDKGYRLEGKKELHFVNNQWDGSVPKCIEADNNVDDNDFETGDSNNDDSTSDVFEPNENGPLFQTVMKNNGTNDHNDDYNECDDDNDNCNGNDNNDCDNTIYDCDDTENNENNEDDTDFGNNESNFTIGENNLKIQLVGKDPNCLNVQKIILKNGFVRKLKNECKYVFQCNQGFTLLGNKEIEFRNNELIGVKPICISTQDIEIEHGIFEIKVDSGIYTLQYKCKDGYKLEGGSEIVIKNGQVVYVKKPSCFALCPVIPFHFGRIHINEMTHIVNFTCDDGYQMEGHYETICENGEWSYPFPICIQTCPKIDLINGEVAMNENIATFRCNKNYYLVGSENSTCLEGQWTNEIPVCTPKCPSIKISQAHKIMSFDWNLTYYNFSCKEGYTLKGNNEIFCRFGQWSGPVPICEFTKRPYQATDGFTIKTVPSECQISSAGIEHC